MPIAHQDAEKIRGGLVQIISIFSIFKSYSQNVQLQAYSTAIDLFIANILILYTMKFLLNPTELSIF